MTRRPILRHDLRRWSAATAVLAMLLQSLLYGFFNSADAMSMMMPGPAGQSMAAMPGMAFDMAVGAAPVRMSGCAAGCCCTCCVGSANAHALPPAPVTFILAARPIVSPFTQSPGAPAPAAILGHPPARGPPEAA